MVEKDWLKESEKLLQKVESLSKHYWQLRVQLITKPTNNPRVFKLVSKAKSLKCVKILKEIANLDPEGLIGYLTSIPFEETLLTLKAPKEFQKNIPDSLKKMRRDDRLRITAITMKAGWIRPLKK